MSWLFSQALVAEFSAATCSAGAPSAPLSVMPTPHRFWRNDKMMEPSQLSRFGLTCAVLTEDHGAALLMWFLADSHVRTYPLPGMVPASMASGQDSGAKWHESSVRYDLASSSWRTHRCLWDEALPWSSVTLPRWGMTRNGFVYQHPTAERPISAKEFGLWPTPRSCSAMAATITPESAWQENRFPNLETVVGRRMWPTPNATDANKWNNQSLADRKAKGQQIRLNAAVSPQGGAGGQLNPTWVEWLMGWPLGWTDLKPLEMARFREWQQQHFPFLQGV